MWACGGGEGEKIHPGPGRVSFHPAQEPLARGYLYAARAVGARWRLDRNLGFDNAEGAFRWVDRLAVPERTLQHRQLPAARRLVPGHHQHVPAELDVGRRRVN